MTWEVTREDIARRLCTEPDSEKLAELAEDLIEAIDSEAAASEPARSDVLKPQTKTESA